MTDLKIIWVKNKAHIYINDLELENIDTFQLQHEVNKLPVLEIKSRVWRNHQNRFIGKILSFLGRKKAGGIRIRKDKNGCRIYMGETKLTNVLAYRLHQKACGHRKIELKILISGTIEIENAEVKV